MSRLTRTPRRTEDLPVWLDGATAFADDAGEMGALDFVRLLKAHPQIAKPLAEAIDWRPRAAEGSGPFGRPRHDGRWELAYFAFVMSGHVDVQPWWKHTTDDLWAECGFQLRPGATRIRPPYNSVWEWFGERLEKRSEAFTVAVSLLIAQARRHTDDLVGRVLWVDGTEAETNARLRHACPPGRECWKNRSAYTGQPEAAKSAAANLDEVKGERQAQAEIAEEDLSDEPLIGPDGKKIWTDTDGRLFCIVGIEGCKYEILDRTAGVRAYTGPRGAKRFWLGFYNQKAIDHYTGAPVAINLSSASIPEWKSYPELFSRVLENVGKAPRAVVADKGFSVSSVFQLHTEQGTATVAPWRKRNGSVERSAEDADRFDRHGIPRCKQCGGETQFVRFAKANPKKPRLWFKCLVGSGDCAKVQSMYCEADWRLLLPMWRTSETYMALSNARNRYERVHHHWRQRYRVASDDHMLRPKRRGIACQQLRANAALVIEWLMICNREGWLASARCRLRDADRRKREHPAVAWPSALQLLKSRRLAGLDLPYGPAAIARDPDAPLRPKGRDPDEELPC
ncbi:MAG: hypothetical protein JWP75_3046 [Frondihabitans sp.]|nr:hypothetical protein [Frondihabitans sp.]